MAFDASRVSAATVYVSYFGLSPDPVNVKVCEKLIWRDADPYDVFAPYWITLGLGGAYTPCYTQFSAPGTFYYTAQSWYNDVTWGGTIIVTVNHPPSVNITNPTNNAAITAPASFSFAADASDPDPNDVQDVQFWVGDTMVDDVFSAPYATTVTSLAIGTYKLTAIVSDYSGMTATNSILITVVNPGPVTLNGAALAGTNFIFHADGLTPGKTNILQCSSNLINWFSIQTNVSDGTPLSFTNLAAGRYRFFRIVQMQ